MANTDHVDMLKLNVEAWNQRRDKGWDSWEDLTGANLAGVNLRGADLYQVDLTGANLTGADLTGAKIGGSAKLINAILTDSNCTNADLSNANLTGATLYRANLTNANLAQAVLYEANLSQADLTLTNATNCKWNKARIDASTNLSKIHFDSSHRPLDDGSDDIDIPKHLKFLQWSFIRNIGQLPLFGVSWIGLATSLVILNNLGWWNSSYAKQILLLASGRGPILDHLSLDIPIPGRLVWTVIDALLLVVGSTLYKFACPQRIQTFTEVEWVEQHGHPRLRYFAESFNRPVRRVITLILLSVGGLLALGLFLASIYSATKYAWPIMLQSFLR